MFLSRLMQRSRACGRTKGRRTFRGTVPTSMGRRSAKIATRKGKEDGLRAKLYGRIGKQIVSTVKRGGPDASSNEQLAHVLREARALRVPKELVERNIARASEGNQADFQEVTYEAYGHGGVGMVVESLTDNVNRAASSVRSTVRKAGGKVAEPGSVLFLFAKQGQLRVFLREGQEEDELLRVAAEAGADDMFPDEWDENNDGEGQQGDAFVAAYRVVTPTEAWFAVKSAIEDAGMHVDNANSGLRLEPGARVECSDEEEEANVALVERLLELDDVDTVTTNMA